MTIRAKLATAIVVAIAGLALTAGVGIWGMDRLGDRFDAVRDAGEARALALQLKYGITDFNGWQTLRRVAGEPRRRGAPNLPRTEIANFERAAQAAESLARLEAARAAAAADKAFTDARSAALRLLIVSSIVAALLVALLLITALDLARAAERALGADLAPGPPDASA